ncbi:MAG: hypothetical protein FVQ81_13335, partial [Candidatus Glassbacteria bacterium]|nr:hypothetical protein [Candidatus Glassbacteria bacterium]
MGQSLPERWRTAIRAVVVNLWPWIERGYHLSIRARVIAVKAVSAGPSTRLGYRYAATVQPLARDGSDDASRPAIPDVP